MIVRPFEFGKDYPQVCEWWRHYGWGYLPKDHIANAFGFVCEDKGKPICVVWLYLTGTALAFVDFVVSNPQAQPRQKSKGIELVINSAKECAVQAGVKKPIAFIRQKSLQKIYEKCGFKKTGEDMIEMAWGLQ